MEPLGVLSGYSAAELLGASCGPENAPAEVTCPRTRRPVGNLVVHQDTLASDEIVFRGGLRLTTPTRTAYDLARWRELTEGVVSVDALAQRFPFDLSDLRALRNRHFAARGNRRLESVLALVDRRAESPMESRIRVALVLGGLPPEVQFVVELDDRRVRLDLAYPAARLGVEYDGRHHRTAEQALRDLHRESALARAGWKVIRFGAYTVLNQPHRLVATTRAELAARTRSRCTRTHAPKKVRRGAFAAITRGRGCG